MTLSVQWLWRAGGQSDSIDLNMSMIWAWVVENQAVIITKDEDFVRRRVQSETGSVIVWLRLGNCRNGALMAYFKKSLPALLMEIEKGEPLVELP